MESTSCSYLSAIKLSRCSGTLLPMEFTPGTTPLRPLEVAWNRPKTLGSTLRKKTRVWRSGKVKLTVQSLHNADVEEDPRNGLMGHFRVHVFGHLLSEIEDVDEINLHLVDEVLDHANSLALCGRGVISTIVQKSARVVVHSVLSAEEIDVGIRVVEEFISEEDVLPWMNKCVSH